MTPSRDELRAALERVAPPDPRPEFVERLGHRLLAMDQTTAGRHVPVFRRPPAFGFLALTAAAVILAVLFVALPSDVADRRLDVTGQPPANQPEGVPGPTFPPESTTTTAPGAVTGTTRPGPSGPTTTGLRGAAPPAVPDLPTGLVPTDRPTTTTRPRTASTTTTTTPAEPETISLACVAGQPEGQPGVTCTWSQSTSPTFYAYRLWRATGTAPKEQAYAVSDRARTTYIDRPGAGVQHYMIEVYDTGGRISGKSAIVEAVCC